jgi:hypothetical protein
MQGFETLLNLPTPVLVGLAAAIVIQLILDVYALMDLYRRPKDQLIIPNKLVWVLVILFINTFGAIAYLVIARKPAAMPEAPMAAPGATRAEDAADLLYGKRIDPQ